VKAGVDPKLLGYCARQYLDRRLQLAVFEAIAGRPAPSHGSARESLETNVRGIGTDTHWRQRAVAHDRALPSNAVRDTIEIVDCATGVKLLADGRTG
jgi:hypothetical protein